MPDRTPDYQSWGRLKPAVRRAVGSERFVWPRGERSEEEGAYLPFGNGRSYGDSCHNDEGTLIVSGRDRPSAIHAFDPETGLLTADAGVLLSEITRHVASAGWFLPVTPGTQFVTLGGAIANDVHGKNHHRRGTFGRWVESLRLDRSDRGSLACSRTENADLFSATIAGMGLTGLIRQATIRLLKVPSLSILQTTTRFDRLSDYFDLAEAADARHEYAVAWIDSLSSGVSLGRGHLIAGDHARNGDLSGVAAGPLASVPLTPPVSPLAGPFLKAFNEAYYRKARAGTREATVRFDSFFYPLDRIGDWNRLYGPRGLHQHQSVIPAGDGEAVVRELILCAKAHKHGSFLTVLKRFGDLRSPGLLSFPRPGYTLTLDFPHRGEKTLRLLRELDRITVEAGGAVNPYKDARMSPETFAAGFPQWRRLDALRDPAISSDFWRRTAGRFLARGAVDVPTNIENSSGSVASLFTLGESSARQPA
ncbi:FAD-binding oxidoreductase [Aurantimonas sp. VKM B-3413]|uniref:FAD-binding oxidoreductase n=1 Tax=Aurantimonas sp. VKM B-3413 TaxID=2779401 RepID=UPI001E51F179|nr:FAD-binding oxidoreductase [Aurantimonas sp. VKM B-3413]MCB8839752.1 FAD-binding oxidoreductase [Aurantimonas sp. VKM B-3413]